MSLSLYRGSIVAGPLVVLGTRGKVKSEKERLRRPTLPAEGVKFGFPVQAVAVLTNAVESGEDALVVKSLAVYVKVGPFAQMVLAVGRRRRCDVQHHGQQKKGDQHCGAQADGWSLSDNNHFYNKKTKKAMFMMKIQ